MIGVVVVFEEHSSMPQVVAADRELLGAPVLARAIASTIPAEREAQVVVAVPGAQVERVREDVVRRYGLIEVVEVVTWQGDLRATVGAALERFGDGVELVLLHDGRRPLVTHATCQQLITSALEQGAAAPVLATTEFSIVREDGGLRQGPDHLGLLQSPIAAQRDRMASALAHGGAAGANLYTLLLVDGGRVAEIDGERDNLLIRDESDLSRAIEVWSRRAIDYPFLWPRPDRFDEAEREAGDERGSSSGAVASASIDQMLAAGVAQDETEAPFDEAMASLADEVPGTDDAETSHEDEPSDSGGPYAE
ncbi:MAG: 2-C-methyl-D-erythritol 4-phosphate cytidylyltransferase [Pseudomonadota bacterium]